MLAVHPGEILLEEYMLPLGLSACKLAAQIGIPATFVQEIITGRSGINVETALRLARFFGTDMNLWINLQAQYEADSMDDNKRRELQKIVPYVEA